MRMVLASTLDSPGKMSYKNRDLVCSPQDYESVAFPPEIGKHRRGYVVVIDVSNNGREQAASNGADCCAFGEQETQIYLRSNVNQERRIARDFAREAQ